MLQHLDGELVALIQFAGRVHDKQHDVAALQRLANLDHHLAAQRTIRLVYAGSVDEYDLRGVAAFAFRQVDNALDSVARGLWFRRNDRQSFAPERSSQRGLAW